MNLSMVASSFERPKISSTRTATTISASPSTTLGNIHRSEFYDSNPIDVVSLKNLFQHFPACSSPYIASFSCLTALPTPCYGSQCRSAHRCLPSRMPASRRNCPAPSSWLLPWLNASDSARPLVRIIVSPCYVPLMNVKRLERQGDTPQP